MISFLIHTINILSEFLSHLIFNTILIICWPNMPHFSSLANYKAVIEFVVQKRINNNNTVSPQSDNLIPMPEAGSENTVKYTVCFSSSSNSKV